MIRSGSASEHRVAGGGPPVRSTSMAAPGPLNDDYERRPFWHASMTPQPDRSGRELPDSADVVVIGGGYAGINAARELARRGVAVTLLEAHTLGWGASTRNGGIVHAGYKWSAGQLIKRYGDETGKALYRETLDSYDLVKRLIAEESIDCDFREGRSPRARVCAVARARARACADEPGRGRGRRPRSCRASASARRSAATPTYGALAVEGSGLLHPGRYFAGLAAAADRGRGRPARGCSRAARSGGRQDGRFVVETSRGAIRGPRRVRRHERLHGRRRADASAPDHPDRLVHHRVGGRCPRTSRTSCRPRVARSSIRRTSCTTGTCRRTAGWSSAGAHRSCRRRSRRRRADPPDRGLARGPPAAGRLPDRVRLGRERRVHVRPDAARRAARRTASRTRWAAAGPAWR